MSNKALTYAEQTLGVHEVYERVQTALESLDSTLADLDKALDLKRELAEEQSDREVGLIGEMRGVHPQMSETAFKTNLKVWEREDAELRRIRGQLNMVLGEIQGLEIDAEMWRARIRVGTSRMEELGGYLHYLAAVKNQAEKTTKRKESTE